MFDKLEKSAPVDRTCINIYNSWDLHYWADELGVPLEAVVEAVQKVGMRVQDVREFLGKQR